MYSKHIITFEIHRSLFNENEYKEYADYYKDIKSRLICCNNSFEYRFKTEDLYIYLLTHTYKHYFYGGTGIRSLLDTYVFLKRHSHELDWSYLNQELASLSLIEFEKKNRELAQKVFSGTPMNDEEKQIFMFYVSSGAYGTVDHLWKNNLSKKLSGDDSEKAKRNYLFDRVFINGEILKKRYPFIYRYKIFLPFLYLYRLIKAVFIKPKTVLAEYKRIKQFKYTK